MRKIPKFKFKQFVWVNLDGVAYKGQIDSFEYYEQLYSIYIEKDYESTFMFKEREIFTTKKEAKEMLGNE